MKRSLALFIISFLLISSIKCLNVDPCKRQPFRGRCPVSANGIQARSQFVLRYYLRNGECVSYPYGHCANDENEPKLFRYKEECQEACIGKRETESINNDDKDSPIRFSPIKPSTPGYGKSQETYETNKPLITTSSSKILTECEKQRIRNKEIFKLECDIDGSYKSLQCNAEKQECFCVDETGKEIPYSRSSPNGVAPDCTAIAKTERRLFNKCTGNAVYGQCLANLTRWYFDESENKCKSFEYSGCGSNGNNYENELACKDRCMPKKPTTSSEDEFQTTVPQVDRNTICSLPKERGPCDRYDLRFYYNKDLNECKYFFYGGCEGNSNNFLKVEDCEATCGGKPSQIKDLPPKNPMDVTNEPKIFQTIPKKNLPIEPKLSPKPLSTTTEYPFTENRCLPPKDSGNCNGNYVRWYWNNERKICESFSYSGCSGNSNNFANREECLSICHVNAASNNDENEKLDPLDVCSHKIDPGDCGGNFIRWAFDKKSGSCIKMRYTGCTGNGNNFANEEDCVRKCIPSRKPVQQSSACFHPIDVGDCDGVFPRFGYDKNTNECKPYTYSGCNGSPNNFGSHQDCAEACIRTRCPPITNCDTTHCHIIQDGNGCQSCECQPIINEKPAIISPPFPIQPPPISKCPIIDVALCVEPCMIFSNRIGCQECVCPKVPTTEKPFFKSPINSVISKTTNQFNTLHLHTSQKPLINIDKTTFKPSVQSPSFVPSTKTEVHKSVKNDLPFKDIVGDKCTLPVDPGPCKDFIERWYFNINTGLCEPFKYGGCGGSKNHFFTRHECEVHCARFSNITPLAPLKSITKSQQNIIKPLPLPILHSQNTLNNIIPIPPKIIIKPIIKNNEVNNMEFKKNGFEKINNEKINFIGNKSLIPTSTFLKIPVVVNVIKKIQKEEEKRPVEVVEENDSKETIEIKQQLVSRGIWIPESMISKSDNPVVTSTISTVEKSSKFTSKEIFSTVKPNLPDQSLEILGNPNNRLMWIQNINPKTGKVDKIRPDEIKPPLNGVIGSVMWVKRWNRKLNKYELINPSQYAFEEYQRRLRLDNKDNSQMTIPSSPVMSTINFISHMTTSNPNILTNNHQIEIISTVNEIAPSDMTLNDKINTITSQGNTQYTNNPETISIESTPLPNQNSLFIPIPEKFPLNTINSEQKPIIVNNSEINNKTNNNSQIMWINVWNEETQKKEIIGIPKDLLQKSTTKIVLESVTLAPGKFLKPPTNENISPSMVKNHDNVEKEIVSNFIKKIQNSQNEDNINDKTFSTIPIKKNTVSTSQPTLIKNEEIDLKNSIVLNNDEIYIPVTDFSYTNFTVSTNKISTKSPSTLGTKNYKPTIIATKVPDISPLVTIFEELIIADDSIYYSTNDQKNKNNDVTTISFNENKETSIKTISTNHKTFPKKAKDSDISVENVFYEDEKTTHELKLTTDNIKLLVDNVFSEDDKILNEEQSTTEIPKLLINNISSKNEKIVHEEHLITETSNLPIKNIFFENNTTIKEKSEKLEMQTDKPISKVYITTLPFEKNYKSLNIEIVKKETFSIPHTFTDAPFIKITKGLSSTPLPDLKQPGLPQKTRIPPQQQFEKFPQSTIEDIVDICNLPSDTGHCLNYVSRWYFNSQKGKCEQFSYGSCGGNKNNFFDRNSCEAKCSSVILPRVLPSLPIECTFEKDEGFGRGYHPKYYFNFRNLHCEQMIYQGQGGNDNRFDNKIKCENTCINKIHQSDNEIKPFPILQPQFPKLKPEKNVSVKNFIGNSIITNAQGTKTVQSIDREGQTGKPTQTKEILTENPELTVTVPSLDDYKKNYIPKLYQSEKNTSSSESGQEVFKIQTTIVPDNGGYPETALIPSQPVDSVKLLQTTTISTTTGYETAESIKENEVKPSTTKNEIETTPYEIETTTDSKNIEPSNINKEEVEKVKTFQPDVSTLSTTSPIYLSTIKFKLDEFNGKDVTNTIPTIKVTTYTDTPVTEKQTITVERIESYTEPQITSSTVQSQTNTQTLPIETTKGQTDIQSKTEDVKIILSSPVPPSIPPSVKIGANLTVEGNVSSPSIKTEIASNITEIKDVTSENVNIKKLDIKKLSTIKSTSTESIMEKTTIKLEIPSTQEVDRHSQSSENDADLIKTNIIQRKDTPESKIGYTVQEIDKIIIKNAPKERLSIVKESPNPTLDYQRPGGNVANGIINQNVDKDSKTLEEIPSIIDPRIPVCPNKKPALLDERLGHPLSCLPGKRPCPEKSSCIFNGVNFYCCPSPEDPYDHHVFGGYNGEEIKNGYKPLSKTLNILSIANHEPITRAKRDSMGLENVDKSLRFEGAPIRQVSRANRLHVNGKMLPICSLEVERGNCDESHVRYFYDARIDQCRMFYYSGCHGNGNNFASQLDCERICKIQDNENLKISKQQKSFSDICGEGKIPFGGENPLVCGTENDSIGCPVGYSCRKEAPFICCPKVVEDNDDSNQLTIKEIIAKKTNKDTRFAPKPNLTYNLYKSNLPRLRTSSGIVVSSSSNICPDGSDSLKEVITKKPVDCGTGGDGHPLCPIGYYCSIDSFTNSRLCCQLGSIGTKVHAPVNESPFVSQRKINSKESFKKDELPVSSDVSSTTPKFSKPLPLSIPSISEKKKNNGKYDRMMLKPVNKGNSQKETFLEENPKLQFDDTEETNIKQFEDPSILMVDEIGILEQKKKNDKTACQISYSEGRVCREDEPVPRTNLQYFYSVKEKKCKIFFYRGCGGNINRFESKKDCETLCMME